MPSPPTSTLPTTSSENPPQSHLEEPVLRFAPEEETSLLNQSHSQKTHANTLYASGQYSQAISEYDKALASCPIYLEYEVAVLKANVAACHLQLAEWEAAVEAATAAIEALERLMPTSSKESPADSDGKQQQHQQEQDEVVELDAADDEAATLQALKSLEISDNQRAATTKLRTKAFLRRAKAKSSLDGWANLQAAEDDYKTLSSPPLEGLLTAGDRKVVREALQRLPARIAQCREREVGEMMGKLKDVGNGILRPFGLSTDMFKVVKDEGSGGYSMSFDQGK